MLIKLDNNIHLPPSMRRRNAITYNRIWRKNNPEKVKEQAKRYIAKPGKLELLRNRTTNWNNANRERTRDQSRRYYNEHKAEAFLKKCRRKQALFLRIPNWTDLEAIKEVYRNCPKGMTVDHIIPLQGKLVSGLHVSSNLQYLTAKENAKKGNRFVPIIEVVNATRT